MTDISSKCRLLPITVAALAVGSFVSSHNALAASTARKFTGAVMQQDHWGPIKVAITVKNKKITKVTARVAPDNSRSNAIESGALPLLKQEVLQAQSANIQLVSGPTGLLSVTITGLDLGTADAYATAAFAMGEEAPAWAATLSGYEAMIILDTRNVLTTPGFPRV